MFTPLSVRSCALAFSKLILATGLATAAISAYASSIFINEIHYDNQGSDIGEAVEIAGRAGVDLGGWSILLYNGNNGEPYRTEILEGILPDQQNGFGTLAFSFPSGAVQNGSPDGIALVDSEAGVSQFISYEGSFTALTGPAAGITSTDIGVAEAVDTPVGFSLQLTGAGNLAGDFNWAAAQADTFGSVNTGQTFVPIPAALPLFLSGILGVGFLCRGGRRHKPAHTH